MIIASTSGLAFDYKSLLSSLFSWSTSTYFCLQYSEQFEVEVTLSLYMMIALVTIILITIIIMTTVILITAIMTITTMITTVITVIMIVIMY